MGFRFQRRITVAPGVRINMGMRGARLSVGPRGASVNIGRNGTYANVGLPGTGLSYRQRIDGGAQHGRSLRTSQHDNSNWHQIANEAQFKILDDGTVEVLASDGSPLTPAQQKAFWHTRGDEIAIQLERAIEKIQHEYLTLLEAVAEPFPDVAPKYKTVPFPDPEPRRPQGPHFPAKPADVELAVFDRFSSGKRAEARAENERRLSTWHQECAVAEKGFRRQLEDWQVTYKAWQKKRQAHQREQEYLSEKFPTLITKHKGFMEDALASALSSYPWPREMIADFSIDTQCIRVVLDIDLPEIDLMPNETARLSKNGRKILFKNLTKTEQRQQHAVFVIVSIFKSIELVFRTLPTVQTVVASGYNQFKDPLGREANRYVISTEVSRASLSSFLRNTSNIDQIITFVTSQDTRIKFSARGFQEITPIVGDIEEG